MKVIVLGGSGLQGKAAIRDLSYSENVEEIICADMNFEAINGFKDFMNEKKVVNKTLNATSIESIKELYSNEADVIINLLPKPFHELVTEQAIYANIPLVNSSYSNVLPERIHKMADEYQVAIMPEAGLDPGIDLVLCGYGVSQLDKVTSLYSYCGGVPEKEAANNPLKYKITWNLDAVLMSYMRPAKMKNKGKIINVPAKNQHDAGWIKNANLLGEEGLELIPNGDAIEFAKILGIEDEAENIERRSIRWSGHAQIWKSLIDLGFLDKDPVPGLPGELSPKEFLAKHLEPKLHYKANEKDLVLMRNIIQGEKDGEKIELIYELLDKRDLDTGLFAMNRTVGYTASIVAQMLGNGLIDKKGMLSPTTDIPYELFIEELKWRGINIQETINKI